MRIAMVSEHASLPDASASCASRFGIAQLNRPEDVAETLLFALGQPPGCEVRDLVVVPSTDPSWP